MNDDNNNIFHTDPKPFIFVCILFFVYMLAIFHNDYLEADTDMSFIEYTFFYDEPTSAELDTGSDSYRRY